MRIPAISDTRGVGPRVIFIEGILSLRFSLFTPKMTPVRCGPAHRLLFSFPSPWPSPRTRGEGTLPLPPGRERVGVRVGHLPIRLVIDGYQALLRSSIISRYVLQRTERSGWRYDNWPNEPLRRRGVVSTTHKQE